MTPQLCGCSSPEKCSYGRHSAELGASESSNWTPRVKNCAAMARSSSCANRRRILLLLLERGQMVTREELRRHLWPSDTFVDFAHSLKSAVMRLREALGDWPTSLSTSKPFPERAIASLRPFPNRGIRGMAALRLKRLRDPNWLNSTRVNRAVAALRHHSRIRRPSVVRTLVGAKSPMHSSRCALIEIPDFECWQMTGNPETIP